MHLRSAAKKGVRTAQTYTPGLVDLKAAAQRSGRRLLRRPNEPVYRVFARFPFEPGTALLDVGANRGQTIASLRLYRADVEIEAFEPNPLLLPRLHALYGDDPHLAIRPFALGDADGSWPLFVPSYRGFVFDGLASLDRVAAESWLGPESLYHFDPRHLRVEEVTCQVRRWDDVETHPGLVKIDVEGSESKVIAGGLRTIERHRPVFIIENDEMAHEPLLRRLGYRVADYVQGELVLDRPGWRNSLFVPEERAATLAAALAAR